MSSEDLATPTPEDVVAFGMEMAALQLANDDGTRMIEVVKAFGRKVALRYGRAIAEEAAVSLAAALQAIEERNGGCSCHMYDCPACQAEVTLDSLRTLAEAV